MEVTLASGGGDELPAEGLVRLRWFAALIRARADVADRAPDEREARLRRPVRVVHARLPTVVVGLVGDVEDQEPAHGRLARSHLERLPVERRLHPFGDGLRRRRLAPTVVALL